MIINKMLEEDENKKKRKNNNINGNNDLTTNNINLTIFYLPNPLDSILTLKNLLSTTNSIIIHEEKDEERTLLLQEILNLPSNTLQITQNTLLTFKAFKKISQTFSFKMNTKNNKITTITLENYNSIDNLINHMKTIKRTEIEKINITTSSPFLIHDIINKDIKIVKNQPFFKDFLKNCEIIFYEKKHPQDEILNEFFKIQNKLKNDEIKNNLLRIIIENNIFDSKTFIKLNDHLEPMDKKFIIKLNYTANKIRIAQELIKYIENKKTIIIRDKRVKEYLKIALEAEVITYNEYIHTQCSNFKKNVIENKNTIILFDYLPIKTENKKYLLASNEEEDFFNALIKSEEEIFNLKEKDINKDIINNNKEETNNQNNNKSTINNKRKKIENPAMKRVRDNINFIIDKKYYDKTKGKEDLIINNTNKIIIKCKQPMRIEEEGDFIARSLQVPVLYKCIKRLEGRFRVGIKNIKIGHMDRIDSFSNGVSIVDNGALFINDKNITIIGNKEGKDIKITIDNILEDKIFYFERKIYLPMKLYPRFYYSIKEGKEKNNNIKDNSNNYSWRRGDRTIFPMVDGRYDISLEIVHGDIGLLLIHLIRFSKPYFNFIKDNNKEEQSDINNKNNIKDNALINKKKDNITTPNLSEALTIKEAMSLTRDLSFDERYFLLCFLCRRGRFFRLDRNFLMEIRKFNIKDILCFLDGIVDKRYIDIMDCIGRYDKRKYKVYIGVDLALIRSVCITPMGMYYEYPRVSLGNRVIRNFDGDKILRVSFREENKTDRIIGEERMDIEYLYDYYRNILNDGFLMLDRKYFFLATSASQLRLHSGWFVTPYICNGELIGVDFIRNWIGDFSGINNIGKYVIRQGQPFSSSFSTFEAEIEEESDIIKNGYNFTDGIGRISFYYCKKLAEVLKLNNVPAAFQIRIAGYKGVVSIDPRLDSYGDDRKNLILRKSMNKFYSAHRMLEVVNYSQSIPAYLNRQIILILEGLGIDKEVFIELQDECIKNTLMDYLKSDIIKKYCPFFKFKNFKGKENYYSANNIIDDNKDIIHECSKVNTAGSSNDYVPNPLTPNSTDFPNTRDTNNNINFNALLSINIINKIFTSMHKKGKIFINKGRVLMGIVDEYDILGEGEIFIKLGDHGVIEDNVMISKNPCLHPGDVRVVKAVDKKILHHYIDVVVFNRKGNRPLFNMCSGGDLDGDLYFCAWDERLIPKTTVEADSYNNTEVLYKEIVSQKDISNFYIKFMKENDLGKIAYSHLAFSDKEEKGVMAPEPLKLATLFNMGVDFPKTGFVPKLPMDLIPDKYPDFMQLGMPSYESQKVLGILFRRCSMLCLNFDESLSATISGNLNENNGYNNDLKNNNFVKRENNLDANKNKIIKILKEYLPIKKYYYPKEIDNYLSSTYNIYNQYKKDIKQLLKTYNVTETELFLGFSVDNEYTLEENKGNTHTQSIRIKELLKKYKEIFLRNRENEDLQYKALAWYRVSVNDNCKSFGIINEEYLNLDLIKIKKTRRKKTNFIFSSAVEIREEYKENTNTEDRVEIIVDNNTLNVNNERDNIITSNLKNDILTVKPNNCLNQQSKIIVYTKDIKFYSNEKFNNLRNDIYSELFHLFYYLEIVNLTDIKFIYEFIYLIALDGKKENIKTKIIEKLIELASYKNSGRIEEISKKILKAALLFSLNIDLRYKLTMGTIENIPKQRNNSATVINSNYNALTVIGMFDINDEIYFKRYKGVKSNKHSEKKTYDLGLLNSGRASINIYKDDIRKFLVGHLWHRRSTANMKGKDNNPHNNNYIEIRICPGKLYFHSLPNKFIYNNIKIRELSRILQLGKVKKDKEYIRGYFYHNHRLVDNNYDNDTPREDNTINIKDNNPPNLLYDYSFRVNNVRYGVYLDSNLRVLRITKGKNIVGKKQIVSIEDKGDTLIEIIVEDVVYDSGCIDLWSSIFNNNLTREGLDKKARIYNLSREEELFLNDKFIVIKDNKYCNLDHNKRSNIRLEVNRITMANDLYIVDKDIFLDNDLHWDHRLKYVVGRVGFYMASIKKHESFEKIFEDVWGSYTSL